MTDWNELFRTDEFRAYRKRQAECLAELIDDRVFKELTDNPQFAAAKELIKLPEQLTTDEVLLGMLKTQFNEDLANITAYLMRKHFAG